MNKIIIINHDVNVIQNDIKKTNNIIRKTILENFLNIKVHADGVQNTMNQLLKQQAECVNEIKLLCKKDVKNQTDINRGPNEKKWEYNNIVDNKYVKLQKNDTTNNKLMERLNTEIDFRVINTTKKKIIEKPFDENFD